MTIPAAHDLRVQAKGAGAVCADVLRALPEWFHFPDAVADYVEPANTHPTVVAGQDVESTVGGRGLRATRAFSFDRGFLPLVEKSDLRGRDSPALQMIKTVR